MLAALATLAVSHLNLAGAPIPRWTGCQIESAVSTGSGHRRKDGNRWTPAWRCLHPPLSTQWEGASLFTGSESWESLWCMCVCRDKHGGHVFASSHLSNSEVLANGDNGGRHNRWCLIYMWNCVIIALESPIKICIKQLCGNKYLFSFSFLF